MRARRSTLIALLAVALAVVAAVAGVAAKEVAWFKKAPMGKGEFNKWAEKNFQQGDEESLQRGEAIACAFCHSVTKLVVELVKRRSSEDAILEMLLEVCDGITKSGSAGFSATGLPAFHPEDGKMVCRRVVHDNGDHLIDAISTGEDPNIVCQDLDLCRISMDQLDNMMNAYAEAVTKEKQEKALKEPKGEAKDGGAAQLDDEEGDEEVLEL